MKSFKFLIIVLSIMSFSGAAAASTSGQNPLEAVIGQNARPGLPWASPFASSFHMGNKIDPHYAVWPRRTMTFSPVASAVAAGVVGGAAVHYGLHTKALAHMPQVIQDVLNGMTEKEKKILVGAVLGGLGAYIYKPVYWGIVQGCWNKLRGRNWDDPTYYPY